MRGNFNSGKRFERVFGANPGLAAGSGNADGDVVDMQNFRSLTAMLALGGIAASAETSLVWLHSDSAGSGFTEVAGSEVPIADDDDNEVVIMTYERVDKRYARLRVKRATANAAVAGAVYISCLARDTLITQPADVHSVNQVEG